MSKQYEPTLAVTSLAGKLSKAMADCLRAEDQSASQNMEAALLCCSIMAKTSKLSTTSTALLEMASAVDQLRELTKDGPIELNTPTASAILGADGKAMQSKRCKGIDLGGGNFSGCDQSAGDCPECGK